MNSDFTENLIEQVTDASARKQPLVIVAGNSKAFYGRQLEGESLSLAEHSGIIDYHPSELVLTARSGTRLSEIEQTLADNNQMLAFEPPRHSEKTTLGGCIACGLSGPARPFAGAARDFVLGTTIINGKGERLKFGGQVMKNVAGYDASRLMVGAQGTLGILLEISVKVLPRPDSECTLIFESSLDAAIKNLRQWILQGHPISASCYFKGQLHVRLSSTENSTRHTRKIMGGDNGDPEIWPQLRHQTHEFFSQHKNLWRLSLPSSSEMIIEQPQLIEWNGALRWVASDKPMFEIARAAKGHACRYTINTNSEDDVFQPLPEPMLALQQRIKQSFDPENILNPGRLYSQL